MKILAEMGRRVERLLYFWLFLVFLNLVVAYLAAAASYILDKDNRAIDGIIDAVESHQAELQARFNRESQPLKSERERDVRVAKQRSLLNLPPETTRSDVDSEKSYRALLAEILIPVSVRYKLTPDIKNKLDEGSPPEKIVKDLQELSVLLGKKSASILGIETPSSLSFQYGASDLKIEAPYLALALLAISLPLAVVWLGSFHITRQRELLLISKVRDHKSTFPHILNWFVLQLNPADYGFDENRDFTKKQKIRALKFLRFATTLFRCFIALSISLLILVPTVYSSLALSSALNLPLYIILVGFLFVFIMAILALFIIISEARLLNNKVFYE